MPTATGETNQFRQENQRGRVVDIRSIVLYISCTRTGTLTSRDTPLAPRITPRKSLGQNFLRDENIARKIIAAIDPRADDCLLEIGPGDGVLTRHLAGRVRMLTVVDVDPRVTSALRDQFAGTGVTVIEGDILDTDLAALATSCGGPLRVVGNIPYNITSPILFHVLDNRRHVVDVTLMVQREVARRMTARCGSPDYGILSVFCSYWADTKLLFEVSPHVFRPEPKVTSAVVQLRMRSAPETPAHDEELFRVMVRTVFGKRRKTLRNSLAYLPALEGHPLPPLPFMDRRPEELTVHELVELSNLLQASMDTHETGTHGA
ncbi:MAG: 16S rRNA (adenine(1518)-N(6)/adenine(1519)-N(6))-dimethyltransferase RsmA [Bacteroidota bacterium]